VNRAISVSKMSRHFWLKFSLWSVILLTLDYCEAKTSDNVGVGKVELQDQILEAIKDSDVLKDWKDKLDDVVKKDNEDSKKKSVITPKETEMLSSFVKAYISENDLPVSTNLVLDIADRAVKSPSPNLPQLFVQLGPVIESLASISKNGQNLHKVVDKHAHILDSKLKTKEALQSFGEVLKSEVVRDSKHQKIKTSSRTKPNKPRKDSGADMGDLLKMGASLLNGGKDSGPDMGDMLKMGASLLKGGKDSGLDMESMLKMGSSLLKNGKDSGPDMGDMLKMGASLLNKGKGKDSGPDMGDMLKMGASLLQGGKGSGSKEGGMEGILKMMSGKGGMASMLKLIPNLLKNGKFKDQALPFIKNALKGTPWAPIVVPMIENMLDSEYGQVFTEEAIKFIDIFTKSESGKRLLAAAPKLFASKDLNSVVNILSKEAEWNWNMFFSKIDNEDFKKTMLDTISTFIIDTHESFEKPSPMMTKIIQSVNHFLQTVDLPVFAMDNPVKSLTNLISQAVTKTTGTVLDADSYADAFADMVQKVLENHQKDRTYEQLALDEKKEFISVILDEEMMQPIQVVWMAFSHVETSPECAQHLLCLINHREAMKGIGSSRQQLTKMASLGAAWTLSRNKGKIPKDVMKGKNIMDGLVNKDKYWELQKAIRSGAKGQECHANFPLPEKKKDKCSLFGWQKMVEKDIKKMKKEVKEDIKKDIKVNLNHSEL